MTPHADAADALAALVLCHDRLDQIDALPQLYVAAGRDLPGSLPGRLVTGAKQINPFLNASVQTYDVGVILLHLLVPQQRPRQPQNADAVCPENYWKNRCNCP